METRMVRRPCYMREFSCIGAACEDTCCSGWQIGIDQNTYNKYEEDGEINKHLRKLDANPRSDYYAEIVLNSDSFCPLLNENKLCSVHAGRGEEYLSDLCATYPRVSNLVNGLFERSAALSCPEAARKALLNPDGIRFEEVEEPMEERHMLIRKLDTTSTKTTRKQQHFFLELRSFTIQVLQNRAYLLSERLLILGMFSKNLQEHLRSDEVEKIPELIAVYMNRIGEGAFKDTINEFPTSTRTQMEVLRKLIDIRIFVGVRNKRYLECLMEALEGIQYTGASLKEESIGRYHHIYQSYYVPFLEKHGYMLENYMVNYVFLNLFPVKRDVFEEYMLLTLNFALLQFHLIGMMGYHRDAFRPEHVIRLVQSFSRVVEHAPNESGRRFLQYLKENEFANLSSMAMLINKGGKTNAE